MGGGIRGVWGVELAPGVDAAGVEQAGTGEEPFLGVDAGGVVADVGVEFGELLVVAFGVGFEFGYGGLGLEVGQLWWLGGMGLGGGWRRRVCWWGGGEEVGVGLAGFGGEPADGAGGDAPVSDHAGGGVDGVADLAVVVGGEGGGDAVEVGDTEEPAALGHLDERLDEVFHLGEGSCRGGGRVGAVDVPRGGVAGSRGRRGRAV